MAESFLQRGGLWVLGQSVLMVAVVGLAVACPGDGPRLRWMLPGIVCFVLGGVIGIAGVRDLGANRTALPKPKAEASFVERGIYARIRHPLYASVMLASVGWALLWQSGLALIPALALIPFLDAKARHEERWLRSRFPQYPAYQKRVKRFLPGIY